MSEGLLALVELNKHEGRVMDCPQSPSSVCAVVTTYRPDSDFPDRVERIRCQVGFVVIVDDGDCPGNVASLRCWFADQPNVVLHHNSANVGIAAALNTGLSIARERGYRWVLTLDDDTVVEPDLVERLLAAWASLAKQEGRPLAVVGVSDLSDLGGASVAPTPGEYQFVEKRHTITSGSLMSLRVYDAVGPFREEFFIDWVDYDYCLRARALGFGVVKLRWAGMRHRLGHRSARRIGWLSLETTNHSALRRYYAYRNATVLAWEQIRRDPLFTLAVHLFQLKTLALVILLERERREKLAAMLRGVSDGWRRRLGKCGASGQVGSPNRSPQEHGQTRPSRGS